MRICLYALIEIDIFHQSVVLCFSLKLSAKFWNLPCTDGGDALRLSVVKYNTVRNCLDLCLTHPCKTEMCVEVVRFILEFTVYKWMWCFAS